MASTDLEMEQARIGDPPDDDAEDRLRHTLRVYEHESDDMRVLRATGNLYGPGVWTGLTLGDLRELANRLGVEFEVEAVSDAG